MLFPHALPKSAFVTVDDGSASSVKLIDAKPIQSVFIQPDQTVSNPQSEKLPSSEAPKENEAPDREPSPEVIIEPGATLGSVTLGRKTVFEMESILENLNVDELLESIEEEKSKPSEVEPSTQREESLEDVLEKDLEEAMDSMVQTVPSKDIQCLVLFDFEARSSEEVSVTKGEWVTALQDGGEWMKIRTADGREGFVPLTYIQMPGGERQQVRAIYEYTEAEEGLLELHVGDIITITEVVDEWLEGYNENGHRGWFPASYVELL